MSFIFRLVLNLGPREIFGAAVFPNSSKFRSQISNQVSPAMSPPYGGGKQILFIHFFLFFVFKCLFLSNLLMFMQSLNIHAYNTGTYFVDHF